MCKCTCCYCVTQHVSHCGSDLCREINPKKIDWTKPIQARDTAYPNSLPKPVFVVGRLSDGEFLVDFGKEYGHTRYCEYTEQGISKIFKGCIVENVPEKPKERWINLYWSNGTISTLAGLRVQYLESLGYVYPTEDRAKNSAGENYVASVKIPEDYV